MDIFILTSTIIQISVGCAIAYFIFHFLRQKQKDHINIEIKNLEAKMSNLRMYLKAKVKKKTQFFRATAIVSIKKGDPFDLSATELSNLGFDKNEDFEKYFLLSKQLNKFLQIDQLKQKAILDKSSLEGLPAPSATGPLISNEQTTQQSKQMMTVDSNFMTSDLKNEFAIIKTIHEMIGLSHSLKEKVDHYNLTNIKNPIQPIQIIHFQSISDVQRIFSSNISEMELTKSA